MLRVDGLGGSGQSPAWEGRNAERRLKRRVLVASAQTQLAGHTQADPQLKGLMPIGVFDTVFGPLA